MNEPQQRMSNMRVRIRALATRVRYYAAPAYDRRLRLVLDWPEVASCGTVRAVPLFLVESREMQNITGRMKRGKKAQHFFSERTDPLTFSSFLTLHY